MNIFSQLFNSKKFWAAVGAALVTVLADGIGLTQDQSHMIVNAIMVYILGQGIADNGKEAAKQHSWRSQ